ncbi:hypothetical protein KKH96_01310, partial [Patescibacteria group bacterium]|nr:hypothetical protein [Patescibacteria group bacterium]
MRSLISAFVVLIIIGGGLYIASIVFDDKNEIEGINMNKDDKKLIFPGEEGSQQVTQQQPQQQSQQPQEFGDEL